MHFNVGSDPFLYPCTSNSQCQNQGPGSCHMSPFNDPSTWFCDCYWSGSCGKNSDCCTNICRNSQCATTGGTQGTLCSPQHQDCASGYVCHPYGDYGYCDRPVSTTTAKTIKTTKTTTTTTTATTKRTITTRPTTSTSRMCSFYCRISCTVPCLAMVGASILLQSIEKN